MVLLLLALIILGPERLPEAIRTFGRVYGQLRRMGEGFQAEMREALEEPMRELRDTAELARRAVTEVPEDTADEPATEQPAAEHEQNPPADPPADDERSQEP